MQVNSSSNQQNVTSSAPADQGETQGAQQAQNNAGPAVFDTSGNSGTQTPGQDIPGFVKDELPPAGENVGTVYHTDSEGKSHYDGYYPAANPYPTNQGAQTPADVFGRGFKDGATHPGQTVGKIVDIAKGDQTKTGENAGKKADDVLSELPVVGEAILITKGMAGEKDADGTPKLPPPPSVQPDAEEGVTPGSPKGNPEANAPAGKAPATENASKPVPSNTTTSSPGDSKAPPGSADKTASAEASSDTHHTNAPRADEAPKASSSASNSKLDVPSEYAYASKPEGNVHADSNSPGVFRDEKGQAYIQADGKDIHVQYDKDNGTWRAYRPDDPAKPQYPVQLDTQGNWQVHDNVGLKGGAPGGPEASGSSMPNRDRIAETTANSPTGNEMGSYPGSVSVVNNMLKRMGFDISTQSADKITENIKQVDAGELAHASASAREVWTFARDVNDSNLSMKDRSAAAVGLALNAFAAPASMAEFDLQNYHFGKDQSADLRRAMQMYVQFEPHT